MANVTPGTTFTTTTAITAANLNLLGQPTVTIGTSEVTNTMLASSSGLGYVTGRGGTVTQATSKATAVTLSKPCGTIVTAADALNSDTSVSFTWTNTMSAVGDVCVLNHVSGGTVGSYTLNTACGASSITVTIRNVTAGNLSEALTIGFVLIKGVTS